MFKKWIILAGCVFGGILFCGLGAGVSFVEFSGLTYAGERQMGTIKEATLNCQLYDYEDANTCFIAYYNGRGESRPEMVSDNSLPAGSVEMDVEYNDDFERPQLYQTSSYGETEDGGNYVKEIGIHTSLYSDPVKIMMKYKDIFLEDMKNGQIGSYYIGDEGYFNIKEIRYSPDLEEKIRIIN